VKKESGLGRKSRRKSDQGSYVEIESWGIQGIGREILGKEWLNSEKVRATAKWRSGIPASQERRETKEEGKVNQ